MLFCRIGACLMLMPGFSRPRIPVKVRLFVAFAITLGLAPLLSGEIGPELAEAPPFALMRTLVSETLIGGLIGFLGAYFSAPSKRWRMRSRWRSAFRARLRR